MVNKRECIDRLLPHSCILCGLQPESGRDICQGCITELPHHGPACQRCAMPLTSALANTCGNCLRQAPLLSSSLAAFRYQYPVAEVIYRFKSGGKLACGRVLAHLLADRVRASPTTPGAGSVLVPIPLHPQRLRQRGFNQAERIARVLGDRLDLPVTTTLLRRIRGGSEQKQLRASARRSNLQAAFEAVSRAPAIVVLIDDVITTGATVNAAAAELLGNGAREVHAWCLARAV